MTIIKTFDTNIEQKGISKTLIIFIVVCLMGLILVQIWVSNTIVSYGEKFEKLSLLNQTLNLENAILENEIAAKSSLINLATRSGELGFSKPESIQYIR